jgi:hypothetical protein
MLLQSCQRVESTECRQNALATVKKAELHDGITNPRNHRLSIAKATFDYTLSAECIKIQKLDLPALTTKRGRGVADGAIPSRAHEKYGFPTHVG